MHRHLFNDINATDRAGAVVVGRALRILGDDVLEHRPDLARADGRTFVRVWIAPDAWSPGFTICTAPATSEPTCSSNANGLLDTTTHLTVEIDDQFSHQRTSPVSRARSSASKPSAWSFAVRLKARVLPYGYMRLGLLM